MNSKTAIDSETDILGLAKSIDDSEIAQQLKERVKPNTQPLSDDQRTCQCINTGQVNNPGLFNKVVDKL
jgi:hypothetical protein